MAVFDIPQEGLPQISLEQILELLRTPPAPDANPLRDRPPQVPPVQGAGPQNAPPPTPGANPMRTEQPQVPPVQGAGPAPNLPALELLSALQQSQTPPVPGQNPVRAEQPQVPPVVDGGPQQPAPQLPDLSLMDTGQSSEGGAGQGLIDFIRNNVPQVDPISILTSDFAQQFNPLTPNEGATGEVPVPSPSTSDVVNTIGENVPQVDPVSILTSEFAQQFNPLTPNEGLTSRVGDIPADPVTAGAQFVADNASSLRYLNPLTAFLPGSLFGEDSGQGAAPEAPVAQGDSAATPPLPGRRGTPTGDVSSSRSAGEAVAASSADGETGSRAADTGSVSPDIRARADRIKAALGGRSQAQNDALRQFAISLLQPIFEGQEFALLGNALQNAQGTFEGTRAQQQAARQQAIENQQEAAETQLSAAETNADIALKQARAQYYRAGGSRSGSKTNDINAMMDQLNIQTPAARSFFREKFSGAFESDPNTLEQPSGQQALNDLVAEARQIDSQFTESPAGPAAQENAQLQELRSLAAQGMARNDLIDEGSVAQAASNPQAEQVLLKAFENNPEELARLKERINAYRTGGAASTAAGATQ